QQALLDLQAELERRGHWALDLQAGLRRLRGQHAREQEALASELDAARDALQAAEAARDEAGARCEQAEAQRVQAEAQREQADAARAAAEARERASEARVSNDAQWHRDQVASLEAQLAQAHGYYQRDCADLAQQRDVALAQRDE